MSHLRKKECNMNAKDLKLDYFQIYNLENPQDVRRRVPTIWLKGQFEKEEAEFAHLQYLKMIANPVRKDNEEYYNKNGHLVWYNMESSDPVIARRVKIENQFGDQKLVINEVVGLLAPTLKRIMGSGSAFTKLTNIDHYKIYRVIDETPIKRETLVLEDQFHERKADLRHAMAFAVPVKKEHAGKSFPIVNEEAHLTIYWVSYSKNMPHIIETRDQFARHRYLKVDRSFLLAAPSKKIDWKVLN